MPKPATQLDRKPRAPQVVRTEAEYDYEPFPPELLRSSRKDRLSQTEWRRRIWHMFPGALPVLLWPIPHEDPISPTLNVILIALIGGLAVAINAKHATIARQQEKNWMAGVIGYSGSIIATILLFQNQLELGFAVLAILAFGDGMATLIGMTVGGAKLPWNREKTWTGSLGFVACAALMSSVMYWGEAQPSIPFHLAFLICGVASFVAGVAESVPMKLNDNVRVGLAAAVTVACMHGLVIGWH